MKNEVGFLWTGEDYVTRYRAIRVYLPTHDEPRWIVEWLGKDALGKPSWKTLNVPQWLPSFLDMIDIGQQAKKR